MSRDRYNDDCPGCRPALLDVNTGKPLKADDPIMVATNKAFDGSSRAIRQAFHNFTCNNSRDPMDLMLVDKLRERMLTEVSKLKEEG
jgi:hypothetical protein